MKYFIAILFSVSIFSISGFADCNGTDFHMSNTTFEDMKINLRHSKNVAEVRFGDEDYTFTYNPTKMCWDSETQNEDHDDDGNVTLDTIKGCRTVTIAGKAVVNTKDHELVIHSIDAENGIDRNSPYVVIRSNQISDAKPVQYPSETEAIEEVSAYDHGQKIGGLDLQMKLAKNNVLNAKNDLDISGNTIKADACDASEIATYKGKVGDMVKCDFGLEGAIDFACNNKTYKYFAHARCGEAGIFKGLFCDENKMNDPAGCKNDKDPDTLICRTDFLAKNLENAKHETCKWDGTYMCDGVKYKYGYNVMCSSTGVHDSLFCTEKFSVNGDFCFDEENPKNIACKAKFKVYMEEQAKKPAATAPKAAPPAAVKAKTAK